MPDVTPQEVKSAVDELRNTVEKYGTESAEYKATSEKIKKTLEASEKQTAEIMKKQALSDEKAVEMEEKAVEAEEKIKDLEIQFAKGQNSSAVNYKELPQYKALEMYIKGGYEAMDSEQMTELKTMRADNGVSGGYMTTTELDSQMIKTITEISPVRQVSRVKKTGKKTLEVVKRTGIPVATFEGEAAAGNDDESKYGNEQLTTYRQTVTVPFTQDLLMDAEWDLESEIMSDVSEAFAFGEGNRFVLGTGAKQPEGFLANAEIIAAAYETETASIISGDDLIKLTGELKVGYNPLYGFNRQTLATLRTLKGDDGHYIWQAGLAPNAPNTIAGQGYVVMQDMPAIADNALPVIYADFLRGYLITDRTGMTVVRDELSKKRQAIVELTFHKWLHGQVVLSEAFKALKVKPAA